jgi:hypothetical protein
MAIEKQSLHRYAHFRIDFGLNEAQQDVQSEVPELVQYDNESGMFVFDFFNLGKRVDTTGYTIVLNFLLPNGDLVTRMVEDKNKQESRAIFYTPSSILLNAGMVQGNVSLYNEEKIQVTSPVRFKFKVQEGIESEATGEDSTDVPILQQLISDVQALKNEVDQWDIKMEQEYDRQQSEFTSLHNQWDENYQRSLTEKEGDYDRFLGQNQADFVEQLEDQEAEFQSLVDQFDEAFNGFDMGGAFEQKFENLEEEYAEQYAETKRITHEIYTTTLTYRFVEDEEEQE